jgi:NifB/MoaA-like Fe-S oxidoreductase
MARQEPPESAFYDDRAQFENGVGMVRALLDDWTRIRRSWRERDVCPPVTLVCGTLIAPILRRLARELVALSGADVRVVSVTNAFFGSAVTVSGLLTGRDVIDALRGRDIGSRLYLPRSMFDDEGARTLDGLARDEISDLLGATVSLVSTMADVVAAMP